MSFDTQKLTQTHTKKECGNLSLAPEVLPHTLITQYRETHTL